MSLFQLFSIQTDIFRSTENFLRVIDPKLENCHQAKWQAEQTPLTSAHSDQCSVPGYDQVQSILL